jgi:hypothetical protein
MFLKICKLCAIIAGVAAFILTIATINKYRLESKKLKAELYETTPKFEVFFIDVDDMIFDHIISKRLFGDEKISIDIVPIWKYPILKNEIYNNFIKDTDKFREGKTDWCVSEYYELIPLYGRKIVKRKNIMHHRRRVTLLVIQQLGKRIAENITIEMDYIFPKAFVNFHDDTDLQYTNEQLGRLENKKIKLGTLNTGQGLLIPLFITDVLFYYQNGHDFGKTPNQDWKLCKDIILKPISISYIDGFDNKEYKTEVRQMLSVPVAINAYMDARGPIDFIFMLDPLRPPPAPLSAEEKEKMRSWKMPYRLPEAKQERPRYGRQ